MLLRIARFASVAILAGYASAAPADDVKTAASTDFESRGIRIQQELQRPTDVQYLETPLGHVVVDLGLRHKIEIHLDDGALAAEGMGSHTPITQKMSDVPLDGALDHLLDGHRLAWFVHDGMLIITTLKAARARTETKVYSVAGFAEGKAEPDYDAVEKAVDSAVFRAVRFHVHRTLRPHRPSKTLVVATNPIEHRAVGRLIGELLQAKQYRGDELVLPPATEAEAKINRVLAGPGTFQYLDTQLEDVRNDIQWRHRIFIDFDQEAIKEAGNQNGRGAEATVNYQAKDVPVASALDLMLDPLGMTWTRDEISIIITSKVNEPYYPVRRLYRVADLADSAQEFDELADLIRGTVSSDSWHRDHVAVPPGPIGPTPGEIVPFLPAKALLVTQTARTHRAIATLLDDLRGAKKAK